MRYPITFWDGIPQKHVSPERIREAAEAGFTIIECRYDTQTNKQVLAWCEAQGLQAYVGDVRIYREAFEGKDGWQQAVDATINDYKDFPAAKRFFIKDEPNEAQFPALARVTDYLREHHPGTEFFINLLPNWAAKGGMANSDAYIADYIAAAKPTLLCYDHYCLTKREVTVDQLYAEGLYEARVSDELRRADGKEGVIYAEEDCPYYFDNLEQIRKHAQAAGIPWMIVILLTEHMRYRYLTEAELRWEVFTALAYGANQLCYYHYWTLPPEHPDPWTYHHGIIESDGTRGEKYPMVKQINREVQAIMAEIGQAQSTAVFHTGPEQDALPVPFAPYGDIDAVEGGNFVVGFFEGGKVILANKDFHNEALAHIKTDKALCKFSKSRGVWDTLPRTTDGAYTVRLHAGDGELLKIK